MTESVDRKTAVLRLRSADDILILCHKNPDGDTIGCAGALYLALKALGKNAAILCKRPHPQPVRLHGAAASLTRASPPPLWWRWTWPASSCSADRNNVQKYAEHVQLCIDHHASNSGYAYETLLDPGAAAACEVMAGVIADMGVPIDASIADCLYTGIATDTGCFRFASTTARTHQVAAHLIEAGADVERLNARLFESRSRARLGDRAHRAGKPRILLRRPLRHDLPDLGPDRDLRRAGGRARGPDQPAPLDRGRGGRPHAAPAEGRQLQDQHPPPPAPWMPAPSRGIWAAAAIPALRAARSAATWTLRALPSWKRCARSWSAGACWSGTE